MKNVESFARIVENIARNAMNFSVMTVVFAVNVQEKTNGVQNVINAVTVQMFVPSVDLSVKTVQKTGAKTAKAVMTV